MTVAELGRRMDADEFGYWQAWCDLEAERLETDTLGGMVTRALTD